MLEYVRDAHAEEDQEPDLAALFGGSSIERTEHLLRDAIARFALDLRGLRVLTEAATGYYRATPIIAALAGAEHVLAVTRDSRFGRAVDVARDTLRYAACFGVADKISVASRSDPRVSECDLVTNLGFVRPLDAAFLARLKSTAAVSLMWETWEHRPEELDLEACRTLGLAVLGTNEHDARLRTLDYTGLIALKLLQQLDLEVLCSRIAVVGSTELASSVVTSLSALGAKVQWLAAAQLSDPRTHVQIARLDALVIAEPTSRTRLLGPGALLEAHALARINPRLCIAHIIGGVDRDALVAAKLRCAPERFVAPPHMSVATDFLGPRPVIDLHTAGLKVGEALVRARLSGLRARDAEEQVLREQNVAQGFDRDPHTLHHAERLRAHTPRCDERVCLTLDMDWAPDFVIDFAREILCEHGVKATFFVTNDGPALERLRAHPELFELGIHPNFLPNSTHGNTTPDVLDHCMRVVPEATSMRSHCLVQSTLLHQEVLRRTPIDTDVSLLLPAVRPLLPVSYRYEGKSLLRLPYGWEDTVAMESGDLARPLLDPSHPHLQIVAFHPIHVFLNSRSMQDYQRLKLAVGNLSSATRQAVSTHIAHGHGMRERFVELVRTLAQDGRATHIREIRARLAP